MPVIQCSICYEHHATDTAARLSCRHTFCVRCLREWVLVSEARGLTCPSCHVAPRDLRVRGVLVPALRHVHELVPTLHDAGHRLAAANSEVLDTAFAYHLAALSDGAPSDLGTAAWPVLAALAARSAAIDAVRLQVAALCTAVTRQAEDLREASVRWRHTPQAARAESAVPLWPPTSRDLTVLEELYLELDAHREAVPRLADDLARLRRERGLFVRVWSAVEAARVPGSPTPPAELGDRMATACARLSAVLSALRSTLEAELDHYAGAAEDNQVLRGQLINGQLIN